MLLVRYEFFDDVVRVVMSDLCDQLLGNIQLGGGETSQHGHVDREWLHVFHPHRVDNVDLWIDPMYDLCRSSPLVVEFGVTLVLCVQDVVTQGNIR